MEIRMIQKSSEMTLEICPVAEKISEIIDVKIVVSTILTNRRFYITLFTLILGVVIKSLLS